MASYHINPKTGEPGKCSAKEGQCPFASEHYGSKEEARSAYEKGMANPFSSPDSMKRAQEEKLLEELEEWVVPGPLGRFLNHPLVQDMMVDAMPGVANARLRDKQKRVAKALENEDWDSYIFLHERPYRFQALQELLYEHELKEPGVLVRSVWMDSENIHENYEEWGDVLSEFGMAMKDEDLEKFQSLPEEFTIYRGCTPEGEEGYSWTLDRAKAEWFAKRFNRSGAELLEAKVSKYDVVAYLGTRGESEIVVLPENLVRDSLQKTPL